MKNSTRTLLQILNGHVLEIDPFGAIDVGGIGKDENGHPWPGGIRESVNTNQSCTANVTKVQFTLQFRRNAHPSGGHSF